jgi:hypothetical protein
VRQRVAVLTRAVMQPLWLGGRAIAVPSLLMPACAGVLRE